MKKGSLATSIIVGGPKRLAQDNYISRVIYGLYMYIYIYIITYYQQH